LVRKAPRCGALVRGHAHRLPGADTITDPRSDSMENPVARPEVRNGSDVISRVMILGLHDEPLVVIPADCVRPFRQDAGRAARAARLAP